MDDSSLPSALPPTLIPGSQETMQAIINARSVQHSSSPSQVERLYENEEMRYFELTRAMMEKQSQTILPVSMLAATSTTRGSRTRQAPPGSVTSSRESQPSTQTQSHAQVQPDQHRSFTELASTIDPSTNTDMNMDVDLTTLDPGLDSNVVGSGSGLGLGSGAGSVPMGHTGAGKEAPSSAGQVDSHPRTHAQEYAYPDRPTQAQPHPHSESQARPLPQPHSPYQSYRFNQSGSYAHSHPSHPHPDKAHTQPHPQVQIHSQSQTHARTDRKHLFHPIIDFPIPTVSLPVEWGAVRVERVDGLGGGEGGENRDGDGEGDGDAEGETDIGARQSGVQELGGGRGESARQDKRKRRGTLSASMSKNSPQVGESFMVPSRSALSASSAVMVGTGDRLPEGSDLDLESGLGGGGVGFGRERELSLGPSTNMNNAMNPNQDPSHASLPTTTPSSLDLDLPPPPPLGWYSSSHPSTYPAPLGESYGREVLDDIPGWRRYVAGVGLGVVDGGGNGYGGSGTGDDGQVGNAIASGSTLMEGNGLSMPDFSDPSLPSLAPAFNTTVPTSTSSPAAPPPCPIFKPNYPTYPHVERMHVSALPAWLEARSREFAYFRHGDRKGKMRGESVFSVHCGYALRGGKGRWGQGGCVKLMLVPLIDGGIVKKQSNDNVGDQKELSEDEDGEGEPDDQDEDGMDQGDLSTLATAAVNGSTMDSERNDPSANLMYGDVDELNAQDGGGIQADQSSRRRSTRNRATSKPVYEEPDFPSDLPRPTGEDQGPEPDLEQDEKVSKRRVPHASYEQIVEYRCCWAGKRRVREVPSKTGKKRIRAPGIKVGCKARLVTRSIVGSEDVDVTYHFYHEGHDPCDPEDIKKVRRGGLHPEIQAFIYGSNEIIDVDAQDGGNGTPSARGKGGKGKNPSTRKRKGDAMDGVKDTVEPSPYGPGGTSPREVDARGRKKRVRKEVITITPFVENGNLRGDTRAGFGSQSRQDHFEDSGYRPDMDMDASADSRPWDHDSRSGNAPMQIEVRSAVSREEVDPTLFSSMERNHGYDQDHAQSHISDPVNDIANARTTEDEDQNAALVGLTNLGRMPVDRMMSDVRSEVNFGNMYDAGSSSHPQNQQQQQMYYQQAQHQQVQSSQQPQHGGQPQSSGSQHRTIYANLPRSAAPPPIPEHPGRRLISAAIHDLHQASILLVSLGENDDRGSPRYAACDPVKLEMVAKESHRLFRAIVDVGEEAKRKMAYDLQKESQQGQGQSFGRS